MKRQTLAGPILALLISLPAAAPAMAGCTLVEVTPEIPSEISYITVQGATSPPPSCPEGGTLNLFWGGFVDDMFCEDYDNFDTFPESVIDDVAAIYGTECVSALDAIYNDGPYNNPITVWQCTSPIIPAEYEMVCQDDPPVPDVIVDANEPIFGVGIGPLPCSVHVTCERQMGVDGYEKLMITDITGLGGCMPDECMIAEPQPKADCLTQLSANPNLSMYNTNGTGLCMP